MRHWTLKFFLKLSLNFQWAFEVLTLPTINAYYSFFSLAFLLTLTAFNFHWLLSKTLWPIRSCFTIAVYIPFYLLVECTFLSLPKSNSRCFGRLLVLHFPLSQGNRRNRPRFLWWNSYGTSSILLTSRATPAITGKQQVEIRRRLQQRQHKLTSKEVCDRSNRDQRPIKNLRKSF